MNGATVLPVAMCDCCNTQLERGETCGKVECPNHPAIKVMEGEGWGFEEVLRAIAEGRWNAAIEGVEQHALVQESAMNASTAEVLWDFSAELRARA